MTLEKQHWSDCAVNNEPAFPAGPCNCGGYTVTYPPELQAYYDAYDAMINIDTIAREAQDMGNGKETT